MFYTITLMLLAAIPAASASAAQGAVTFVKWTEPKEQSFSVDVP